MGVAIFDGSSLHQAHTTKPNRKPCDKTRSIQVRLIRNMSPPSRLESPPSKFCGFDSNDESKGGEQEANLVPYVVPCSSYDTKLLLDYIRKQMSEVKI